MKASNIIMILLLVSVQLITAQKNPREILHGRILADSLSVDNINISNISTKRVVVSDKDGYFNINARENDTLVFSGLAFESRKIILKKTDFLLKLWNVRLNGFVNPLNEVVVGSTLTGNLDTDQQNVKVMQLAPVDVRKAIATDFEDDAKSSPDNTLMPGYVNMKYMPDLVKIAKLIFRDSGNKKQDPKIKFISPKIFPEAVREKFPESFFVQTLHLKPDDIGLFLSFCENDPAARPLLEPKREFELINFLMRKSEEFKLLQKK